LSWINIHASKDRIANEENAEDKKNIHASSEIAIDCIAESDLSARLPIL